MDLVLIDSGIERSFLTLGPTTCGVGSSISGVVTKLGVPLHCRVRLFEKLTGKLITEKLTNIKGEYVFTNLSKQSFFIVAHDLASKYNSVIQDNVVPK